MAADPTSPASLRASRWAAGVMVLAAVCYWWAHDGTFTPHSRTSATPAPTAASTIATPLPEVADTPAPAVVPPPAPVLPASNAFTTLDDYRRRRALAPQTPPPLVTPPPGRTPGTELGRVAFLVRDYRAALGSNPVGSNKEITRALLGDNPRGTRFLDPATVTLDAKGEWLDAWGRPYFFHAMSGTVMEIRSAGPDGRLFTADDLVR